VELVIAGIFPLREDAAGRIYDPLGVHMVNGTIFFLSIGVVLIVMGRPCRLHAGHGHRVACDGSAERLSRRDGAGTAAPMVGPDTAGDPRRVVPVPRHACAPVTACG
jgi:hypothetical protein